MRAKTLASNRKLLLDNKLSKHAACCPNQGLPNWQHVAIKFGLPGCGYPFCQLH